MQLSGRTRATIEVYLFFRYTLIPLEGKTHATICIKEYLFLSGIPCIIEV